MVLKFKSLSALEEILAQGEGGVGWDFSLRGGSVRRTTRLPGMFFLTLFYYYFI